MESSLMAIKMRILLLLVCSMATCRGGSSRSHTREPIYSTSHSLEDSLMTFSAKSFKIIGSHTEDNLIYSPLGAWMNMALASYGAKGTTLQAMRSALAFPPDNEKFRNSLKQVWENFKRQNKTGYEVTALMKMYLARGLRPRSEFVSISEELFKSSSKTVDFSDSERTGKIINTWAADVTNNRITNIIDPDSLDKSTRLMIVGAVYFKAKWAEQFRTDETKPRPFHVTSNKIIPVPTMCRTARFVHGNLPQAKATFVKLPYAVDPNALGVSMFVLLPNDKDGLATLLENLEKDFEHLSSADKYRRIQVFLPKFAFESSIDLVDPFTDLGSDIVFTEAADLSGLTETSETLGISKILQKAFIEVHEEGTEAGAVTVTELEFRTSLGDPLDFIVDRPFVCVIMTDNKVPLFTAIVRNPLTPQ